MQFIDLKKQYQKLQGQIQKNMSRVFEHGQFINGPEVVELENRLAELVSANHCIAVGSGTDALLCALLALDIGPGDEVITTPFTFIATVSMVRLLGAKPVLVDIDKNTFTMDPLLIEKAITSKTKAIIPVDLYGQCADYTRIQGLANRYHLPIIADAAQSLGATHDGKNSGTLGTITCTSFYPAKPLGAYGEAGACFTSDAALAKKLKQISNHGQEGTYNHLRLGINARLDSLQAAILLAKCDVFQQELICRQQNASMYTQCLDGLVTTPYISPKNRSAFSLYTVCVERRDQLREHLQQVGIPTAVHYPKPVHLQPAFSDLESQGSFPIAESLAEKVLSLPMHPYLTPEEIKYIGAKIAEFVGTTVAA